MGKPKEIETIIPRRAMAPPLSSWQTQRLRKYQKMLERELNGVRSELARRNSSKQQAAR